MSTKLSDTLHPDGKFSRGQFAAFFLGTHAITTILALLSSVNDFLLVIMILWSILAAYITVVAGIRRLHDLGYGGQYILLAFIPPHIQ